MMRARLTRLLSLFALAAAMFMPVERAWARAGATLVAIVTADPSAPLTRGVREQLEGLGLDVIVLRPPAEGSLARAPLEQAARNVGAVAAIRLVPSADSVEVWVADRVTGKAVARELVAPAAGGAASDAAVALGAVELLRASLMELHSAEPPHGDVPASEQVRALALPARVEPSSPRLGLSLGAGVALGLSGAPSVDGDGALWLRLPWRFGLRAFAALTLSASQIMAQHGLVDVSYQLGGLEASYDLAESVRTWVPVVGLGIAAAHVTARGTAIFPFQSAIESVWLAIPVVHVGGSWAFVRGLRLRADALAGWALPSISVRVPDANPEPWGAPLVKISLGVEMLWAP
jgi:hypothetical protein